MKPILALSAASLIAFCGLPALAQEAMDPAKAETTKQSKPAVATLKAGDAAPALSIEKWVKGDAITAFEKDRVYVVEFWATWCGPCIASMPHLTELQSEYASKGVRIIGVTTADPSNTLDKVEEMVKAKGDVMGYTVAWDKGQGTKDAYMKAAAQRGIPTAFVIDGAGKIAYIGHPMTLDIVLDRVVSGKWNVETGPGELTEIFNEQEAIFEKASEDPKAGLEALNAFAVKQPKLAQRMDRVRYDLMVASGDAEGAAKVGATVVADLVKHKDALGLNEFAWAIVDPDSTLKVKDIDLAIRSAKEAVELTEEKEGAILDTLARCYWLKGDKGKAVELQKKAIAVTPAEERMELESSLKEYESGVKN